MAEKEAQFRFEGYKIVESTIRVDQDKDPSSKLEVNFEHTAWVEDGVNEMRLMLDTTITDSESTLSMAVKAVGYFVFDEALDEEMKEIFFKTNAPAILFPYIRAYITTLSALSGVKPIILPTLNLSQR